jgi:hypothetical protein
VNGAFLWLNGRKESGIARKKLVDPTEWHEVAVVGMEVELEKLGG